MQSSDRQTGRPASLTTSTASHRIAMLPPRRALPPRITYGPADSGPPPAWLCTSNSSKGSNYKVSLEAKHAISVVECRQSSAELWHAAIVSSSPSSVVSLPAFHTGSSVRTTPRAPNVAPFMWHSCILELADWPWARERSGARRRYEGAYLDLPGVNYTCLLAVCHVQRKAMSAQKLQFWEIIFLSCTWPP